MNMSFELTGKSNAVIFVAGSAPTEASKDEEAKGKTSGGTYYVGKIVTQIQIKEHLLVLMDSNAFAGNRGRWGEEMKATVSGRVGGTSLSGMVCDWLTFAESRYSSTGAYRFSTPQNRVSHTCRVNDPGPHDTTIYILTTFSPAIRMRDSCGASRSTHRFATKNEPDFDHHPLLASFTVVRLLVGFVRNHHKRVSKGALHLQLAQADLRRREQ